MANESKDAWEQFQRDMRSLAGELRRQYKAPDDEKRKAELNQSLERLRQAADSVFSSLEAATRDPEVRAGTRQAARSFGTALAETFREVGGELDKAFRKPPPQ